MNAKRNSTAIACVLIIIAFACAGTSRVHIRSIKEEPGRYSDQRVAVQGKVVETFALPFLGQGLCKVSDGTGEIWVKPRGRVPFKGDKIRLMGKVKVGLTFGDKSFGVIIVEDDEEEK
ncbi:hypothetical protein JXJ21_15780 [candidate division KSB1 bacterium]|nr:hypothetical protein [candidate division KSB1 bacterium]